jgi:hypothetical protein
MFLLHGKIGRDYGWEFSAFHRIRDFKEGTSFFELNVSFDKYKCDHNPKFETIFILFNFKIFEFTIYNLWHIEDCHSPYYKKPINEGACDADAPNYEKNNCEIAVFHSRKSFYDADIYWYAIHGDKIPEKFLRIGETPFFEYGGTHLEAIKALAEAGFEVVEGKEF